MRNDKRVAQWGSLLEIEGGKGAWRLMLRMQRGKAVIPPRSMGSFGTVNAANQYGQQLARQWRDEALMNAKFRAERTDLGDYRLITVDTLPEVVQIVRVRVPADARFGWRAFPFGEGLRPGPEIFPTPEAAVARWGDGAVEAIRRLNQQDEERARP